MKISTHKLRQRFILVSLILITLSSSCKKELERTRDQLLTDHVWVYADYITNYSEPTSIVLFRSEKTNNILDLSLRVIKFKTDRTYEEVNDVTTVVKRGTWSFNSASEVEVKDDDGNLTFTIITLDANFFTWTNKVEDTFGTMTTPDP